VSQPNSSIDRLMAVIEQRKRDMPEDSYTAKLLAAGPKKIRKKIVEEAAELFEAALEPGPSQRDHLVQEAADLVYHVLVLLAACDVPFTEVEAELARREGVSGLEEKARRTNDQ